MSWDIFASMRKPKKGGEDDPIGDVFEVIEKFAPRKYGSERELYYYNYKIMRQYLKPLLTLLETLAQKDRLENEPAAFAREIFIELKDFYDPKDRLSLTEAMEDPGMINKFKEILLFFYDRKGVTEKEIKGWIRDSGQ